MKDRNEWLKKYWARKDAEDEVEEILAVDLFDPDDPLYDQIFMDEIGIVKLQSFLKLHPTNAAHPNAGKGNHENREKR